MKNNKKRILAFLCAVVMVATTFLGNWYTKPVEVKAAGSVEPISLDGYENVTISDFVDANENQMPEGNVYTDTNSGGGTSTTYSLASGDNLNKKLLSMNVTFTGGNGNARLDIGGTGGFTGFSLHASGDNHYLFTQNLYGSATSISGQEFNLSQVGYTKAVGEDLLVQLAISYADTTLTVDVYVDGTLLGTTTLTGYAAENFGGCFSIYVEQDGYSVQLSSVEWPPEPIQLEGFGNLTLKDFIGDSGYTFTAGEYSSGVTEGDDLSSSSPFYTVENLSNFDKQLLSFKVEFSAVNYRQSILFGGTGLWDKAFNMHTNESGDELVIERSWGSSLASEPTYITMYKKTAGVTSFVGEPLLIQMSFEYGEADENNQADLTLGVYINGNLYNDEKFVIQKCYMDYAASGFGFYLEEVNDTATVLTLDNVQFPAEPVYLDGYTNVTVKDFVNKDGDETKATVYNDTNSSYNWHYLKNQNSFDKTLFSARVKFNAAGDWSTRLELACTENSDRAIIVRPNADGSELSIGNLNFATSGGTTIWKKYVNVASFVDNEFLLQLSFDYGELSDSNTRDITVGIYIDGVSRGSTVFYGVAESNLSNYMEIYRETGSSIELENVEFDQFYGYDEITVEDFVDASGNVMESKAYEYTTEPTTKDVFQIADGTDFDKKVLAMNLKFKKSGNNEASKGIRITFAGVNDWQGFWIYLNDSGEYLTFVSHSSYTGDDGFDALEIKYDAVEGMTSFLNQEFKLQIAMDIEETETDGYVNVNMDVYINDALIESKEFTNCQSSYLGNYLSVARYEDNATIIVGSVNEDFPVDMGIQPSIGYEKITFGQFGIYNKTYSYVEGDFAVQGAAKGLDTLNKTVLCGEIFLEASGGSQIVWGGNEGWNGLRLFPSENSMSMTWYNSIWNSETNAGETHTYEIGTMDSTTAGVKFLNEKYDLMISGEIIDYAGDGNTNDVKIGIWFNGILYNQQYFYFEDHADLLGNRFAVYCSSSGDQVTFESVEDLLIQPDDTFTGATYDLFGIEDGTYEHVDRDFAVTGQYLVADTLDKVVVVGDVFLSGSGTFQYIVGGQSQWDGLRLFVGSKDSMSVHWYEGTTGTYITTINAADVGVEFEDDSFELKMSFEVGDYYEDGTNDIKVGFWFDNFFYDYVYVDDKGDLLGAALGIYCEGTDSYTIINSTAEYFQSPDPSFDKVTFSDFGIESQQVTVNADDFTVKGVAESYSETGLDGVVFSGDFRCSNSGYYQIIYGSTGWNGLRFIIETSGDINVYWSQNGEKHLANITPSSAGVTSFIQKTFNLKISTELVDADGNSVEDIRIGIWFNGVRYGDYFIVNDMAEYLKNELNIYAKGYSMMIRNVDSYQNNPYYEDDISQYRGDEMIARPAPIGFTFSGWYKDDDYAETIGSDTAGSAWARYVEEDVLSVRPQVKLTVDSNSDGVEDSLGDKTDLRVVTTVDALEYKSVSFKITKEGSSKGTIDVSTLSSYNPKVVFEKLYAVSNSGTIMKYTPNVFSWQSKYFKTFTIRNIPESEYGTKWTITPYWTTLDGTIVEGETLVTCVNDYLKYKSDAEAVDFIGDHTMPITGFHGPYVHTSEDDAALFPEYISDEYFKMIADSGVNVIIASNIDYASQPGKVKQMLELGEKYGIGIFVQDSTILSMTDSDTVKAQIANYSGYKSFSGMYLVDEPGTDAYNKNDYHVSKYTTISTILNNLDILTYVNMYPIVDTSDPSFYEWITGKDDGINETDQENYSAYVAEVNSKLNPAVLQWDYYPFAVKSQGGTEIVTSHSDYFWNMAEIRKQAQAVNKPFWAYVQAGGNWNNDAENYFDTGVYYPDEGEFNWNMNTALAFGAQGIQYFPLIQPYHFAQAGASAEDNLWDFERNGLIGAFGNKTQWYYYAEEANKHVGAIDHILMNSYNEQIIAVGDAANDTKDLIGDCVKSETSWGELASVDDGANALIGCFNYKGKTALYVVNYDYENTGEITLNLTGEYDVTIIRDAKEYIVEKATSVTFAGEKVAGEEVTGKEVMSAGEGILLVIE